MQTLLALTGLSLAAFPLHSGLDPDTGDRVVRIRDGEPVPEVHWSLAIDRFEVTGSGWVAAVLDDGRALARHLPSGREVRSPDGLEVQDLRFRPGHEELWFALGEQGLQTCLLTEGAEPKALDMVFSEAVDQFEFDPAGGAFAWRCRESSVLRVVSSIGVISEMRTQDHWTETARFENTVEFPFGGHRLPPFEFARGGRSLVFTQSGAGRSATSEDGEGIGQLYDLNAQEFTSSFRPYVCRRSRGWALGREGVEIFFARREAMSDWAILGLTTRAPGTLRKVDRDARGKHFIDLYLDASGRWLAESDHEEDGVRLYDLEGETAPVLLGGGEFLGFDRAPQGAPPLIFADRAKGLGLDLWSTEGALVLEDHARFRDRKITRIESFGNGNFLGFTGRSTSKDSNSIDYTLEVLALPADD